MAQHYLSVQLEKGEGGYALMRRYGLDKSSCSFAEFYRINNLKNGDPLVFGKKYLLPIKVYKYNNSSIRSTLKNFDLVKALEVERYNKWAQAQKIKSVYFLQDRILWVPYYIYNCEYESGPVMVAPEKPNTSSAGPVTTPQADSRPKNSLNIPLFGDKYQNVEIVSYKLKGQVYYIKCGHGGPDPGAMVKIDDKTYCEDEYAYDIALRLGRLLISNGAIVHFIVYDPNDGIRDDEYLPCDKDELHAGKRTIPINQILRLRERVAIINKFYKEYKRKGVKDQRFISIHIDSRSKGLELDTHFYYAEGSKIGYEMASNTQSVFERKYAEIGNKTYSGTIKNRDLYVVKYSYPPALFVEIGNIQNEHDQKRFVKADNRQTLAEWLFEGVTQ
ncbi:MAG: N-acetylmuramoyl-L-alanine amidase [Saprospiraceae bacterium]|nr:N-acetylmuramoyl-L-alanine amidase [Saprospiraceae bacterium]